MGIKHQPAKQAHDEKDNTVKTVNEQQPSQWSPPQFRVLNGQNTLGKLLLFTETTTTVFSSAYGPS